MKTLRVLIVEDYKDTAETLAEWVTSSGHAVEVCYSGFQAEQALLSFRPDVVLLDIGLPDMDGWELAPLLRKGNASLLIIAVTVYQSYDDRQKSKDAGIDFHLVKPVRKETITGLLQTAADGLA